MPIGSQTCAEVGRCPVLNVWAKLNMDRTCLVNKGEVTLEQGFLEVRQQSLLSRIREHQKRLPKDVVGVLGKYNKDSYGGSWTG